MRFYYYLCTFFFFVAQSSVAQDKVTSKEDVMLMGCGFEIKVVADNEMLADSAISVGIHEITRIENLISGWDDDSQTSEINRQAGKKAVKVDEELYDLIYRSKKLSELTDGAFDISFASMDKIWVFDGAEHDMPDSSTVAKARANIDWQKIELNPKEGTVFLKEEGMKIGFGAIGKGYAANRAKLLMEQMEGVYGGIINASGDLMMWGESVKTEGWSVQISDPRDKFKVLGWLKLNNASIVTSGDYVKYFMNNGVRYSHIIDPKTGYPVTETQSVTIISPDAELSDALATAVSVLGVEQGLALINMLNHVEGLILDENDEIYFSDNLELNYYKE